jgi:hypothetical protein
MTSQTRVRVGSLLAALAVGVAACHQSDSITGPAPTPTPVSLSVSGQWVGTFQPDSLVLCSAPGEGNAGEGTASAELEEAGSTVSGSLAWRAGSCHPEVSILATRIGDSVSGTVTWQPPASPAVTGTLTGAVDSSELRFVVGVLSGPQSYQPGGTLTLHRP